MDFDLVEELNHLAASVGISYKDRELESYLNGYEFEKAGKFF